MTRQTNTWYSVKQFSGTQADMDRIAHFHRWDIREWQEATGCNRFTDIDDSQADLRNITDYYAAPGNFWVARNTLSGQILGMVGLRDGGDGTAEVKRFAVRPDCQGRGIGDRLITALMAWAGGRFREAHLSTGYMENAANIYHRHGFRWYGAAPERCDNLMRITLTGRR